HRRVVRHISRPLHAARPPAPVGPAGNGGRGAPGRRQGVSRDQLLGESRQAADAELPLRPLGPVLVGLLRRECHRLHAHRVVVDDAAPIDVLISLQPVNIVQAAADLLWSPVLRKFPDLRVALSEGGIGWIPYFHERVDWIYTRHHPWTGQDFGGKLPSEVFRERVVKSYLDDLAGLEQRHRVGVDNICWETDYPHSDSTWPTSPEFAMRSFEAAGVPDDEINAITYQNALRHFRFDPFALRP